jgi:hypothetical protein
MSNVTYAVLRDRLENLKAERSAAAKNYRLAGRNKYDDPDGTIARMDEEIVEVENQIDEMLAKG